MQFRIPSTLVLILLLAVIADLAVAQSQQSAIKITSLVSGVDASFRGMAVRNRREAWIGGSGGTVIRTTDSGISWKRIIVPDADELDFRDVEILPDGTVLLMSVGSGKTSRVFRSIDGGKTWSTVLVNSEPNGFFDGMTFRQDGRQGVLFGDPINGRLDIYKTSNGGATWNRLPLQHRPKLNEGEYGFAASGTGIVAKGRNIWVATGGSVARVWHSPDNGMTWNSYDSKVRSGNESSGIFSIEIIDDRGAVAIGGNYAAPKLDEGNVATSSDGGKTWVVAQDVRMPHKACVQSLGGDRLITCGRTGVAFSEDAGRTWTTISSESYYTLRADRNSRSGFLAGKDGRIARFKLVLDEQ